MLDVQTYISIPIELQAIKLTNENKDKILDWIPYNIYINSDKNNNLILVIRTLEGDMRRGGILSMQGKCF
jgi:hypothetical protein